MLIPLGLVGAFVYYWLFLRPYESTDDAFIDGNVIGIAPRVVGQVTQLLVVDNQRVQPGDLLVQIDPRTFQAGLAQAQAALAAAQTRLEQAKTQVLADAAKLDQERAGIVAAQSEADRATADLKRFESVDNRAIPRSQFDQAVAQVRSDTAALEAARSRVKAAEAQQAVSQAAIETAKAEVERNQAAVRQAQLELSYTKVVAPTNGFVTHRTVEAGDYVQAGQALLAVVAPDMWVTANFKETQLRRMQPGQPVTIHIDAYPNHTFHGHVDSIQRGSGARFSLLPPENATGNYVKVVQRVPVKILFDGVLGSNLALGPGMSVEPKVRVIEKGRKATQPRDQVPALNTKLGIRHQGLAENQRPPP